jgi:hypothetical protein
MGKLTAIGDLRHAWLGVLITSVDIGLLFARKTVEGPL